MRIRNSGCPWAVVCVVFVAVQLVVLYTPSPGGGGALPGTDKVVHALVFALPVLAAGSAGRWWHWVAWTMVVHAPISEIVQHLFLPTRSGDPWDVVADLMGVAGAAWVVRRRSRPSDDTGHVAIERR
ncbi:VanZ family protein [Austwickia chelonae]|uniref:VanZ family protein n=1 Tax=Austwickia chelonae TaxID=100225 RepID=UPI001966D4CA|nr:VanZ family protein [Austwickia chelonae]